MADAVRRGLVPRLPDRVLNAPRLYPELEVYWLAFTHLNTCRPPAFEGVCPIPLTAVLQYASFKGFNHEQAEELDFLVSRMDIEYMRWVEQKHKRERDSAIGRQERRSIDGSGQRPSR